MKKPLGPIPPIPDEEFIRSRSSVDDNGCWIWTGATSCRGRRPTYAHKYAYRISYEVFHGPVPDGLMICHHCDVPMCVNPQHIYAGTSRQNRLDAMERGQNPAPTCKRGSAHHNGQPDSTVEAVRRGYASGVPLRKLASIHGISLATVQCWVYGKTRGLSRIYRDAEGLPSARPEAS